MGNECYGSSLSGEKFNFFIYISDCTYFSLASSTDCCVVEVACI